MSSDKGWFMNEIIMPNIEDSKIDKLAALSKGLLGMVPFAGSILSEIIGNIIPNQRIEDRKSVV